MDNKILETLRMGKELAESNTATMLSGGKKLREYFRIDIANILNKRSQRETPCWRRYPSVPPPTRQKSLYLLYQARYG